jgi:polyhydroxybutyrate depolymerase
MTRILFNNVTAKEFMMVNSIRRRTALVLALCIGLAALAALLLLVGQVPARATSLLSLTNDEPPGTVTTRTVALSALDVRHIYTYEPVDYTGAVSVPLVIAFHGGGGSGRNMLYGGRTDIWGMAERETFLVVYPDGEVIDPDHPNKHYWAREELNIPFVQEHVISYTLANYNVDPGRIYIVGFSGGAKLTFKIASDPQVSRMIAGIGTVAGGPAEGDTCGTIAVIDPRLRGGRPLPVFLVQGGKDPKQPPAGGYDNKGELDLSFAAKVDLWVNHLGATQVPAPDVPQAPDDATVRLYETSEMGPAVMAVVDPQLRHTWPEAWQANGPGTGMMGAFWGFFSRYHPADAYDRSLLISSEPTGCVLPRDAVTFTMRYTNTAAGPISARGVFTLPVEATLADADAVGTDGVTGLETEMVAGGVRWEGDFARDGALVLNARMRTEPCSAARMRQLTGRAVAIRGDLETDRDTHFVTVDCVTQRVLLPAVLR